MSIFTKSQAEKIRELLKKEELSDYEIAERISRGQEDPEFLIDGVAAMREKQEAFA